MTSGEFETVSIDFVFVNRDVRQRRELKNINELAASISRVGLIHPPVIERTGELRTGERRLTALRQLGWTSIPIQWVDELDEAEAQALELEENISRVDIEWKEECLAVHTYHSLRVGQDPNWTQTQTAEMLGMSGGAITQKLDVAKQIIAGDARVLAAPKFSTARNITARASSRAAASAMDLALGKTTIAGITDKPVRVVPLLNEDFHDWSAAYTGPRFNVIHCDFPYGVNADKHDQGQAAELGGYADSPDIYFSLLDTLGMAMSNVVADSAHLIFWFSMDFYTETLLRLTSMGWKVNPFPLVWFKNDNVGILPDAQRGPRRVYETAFFASRGDRLIVGAKANAFGWPGRDKEIHMSEKPVPMLKHFMEMVVDENSRVFDPTAGSANALKAATSLGAPTVLGLERDVEFYTRSCEAYYGEKDD